MSNFRVEDLGQVFTPPSIVDKMIGMMKNGDNILEPSCGDGAFFNVLSNKNIVGIELDKNHCPNNAINMDFFDYSIDNKFDTIIGNPPYVAGKNINKDTLLKINSEHIKHSKSNLYLYFIEKSINHLTNNGEIIFITPREFIKNTSAIELNKFIYEQGTITHWYEYGDEMLFKGYSPNVVIFRFEKNNYSRKTLTNNGEKIFNCNGQISFTDKAINGIRLGDLFKIKVGAVSGLDEIFANDSGNCDFVCSYTNKTGKLKKFHYNIQNEYLLNHKELLLNRKMKKFNENNWWTWGRDFYHSDKNRIYVNCKTRNINPFFINECKNYDGSVLALIPLEDINDIELVKYKDTLNNVDWEELGFKIGGRFCFNQKALENTILEIRH